MPPPSRRQLRRDRLSRNDLLKGVHECRPFLSSVGREVDRSTKPRAGDFYPLGFRGRDVGEVFDRVDLCDGGVENLSNVGLVDEITSILAREKREDCRFASVDPEQRDRLIEPLQHGQGVRTGLLLVEKLFHFRDVLVRYGSEPHVIGDRVTSHWNHSRLLSKKAQGFHSVVGRQALMRCDCGNACAQFTSRKTASFRPTRRSRFPIAAVDYDNGIVFGFRVDDIEAASAELKPAPPLRPSISQRLSVAPRPRRLKT